MVPSPARRCAEHGLVVGPDGRCVLCRRGAGTRSRPAATVIVALLLVSAVIAGLWVYRAIRYRTSAGEALAGLAKASRGDLGVGLPPPTAGADPASPPAEEPRDAAVVFPDLESDAEGDEPVEGGAEDPAALARRLAAERERAALAARRRMDRLYAQARAQQQAGGQHQATDGAGGGQIDVTLYMAHW